MEGNTCRLCLSKEKLIWIFDNRIINTNKLSDIIYNATGIHISESDPVTQMVCHECCLHTVDIYKFRLKCAINNNFLYGFVNQVKKEPVDEARLYGAASGCVTVKSETENHRETHGRTGNERLENARTTEQQIRNDKQDEHKENENETETSPKSNSSTFIVPSHRLMVTRAKRKLKSDIEKQRIDKQRVIESLYAENIDKIMFFSYLKLAPRFDTSRIRNKQLREGMLSCKLCKLNVDSATTLREHLANECTVFKMIDNSPTVDLVKVDSVKNVKERYASAFRSFRSAKKPKRFRCSCCDSDSD